MSKSNGDFLTLQSLIEYGYHPLSYRLMLLQSHYQNEVIFDWETLQSNQTRLKRWVKRISELKIFGKLVELNESSKHMLADSIKSISDNLNTSKILGTIDKFLDDKSLDSSQLLSIIFEFDRMLGMNLYYLTREQLRVRPINSTISEIEISNILEQRIELKRNKNYQESDRLRDYLISNRISVLDGDSLQWDYIPVID
jgi:cysteinyl-tRNA synthetase